MFTDFEFNGRKLSELGLMVCSFNGVGLETIDIGSNRTLNTINRSSINEFHIMSTKHDEPFSTKIQICKTNCDETDRRFELEDNLVSYIMKWLLSKRNRKFKMIYEDTQCYDMYYIGTFTNVHGLKLGSKLIGLEITFKANASFGYYEPLNYEMDFSDTTNDFCINDISDEEGYIYPHKFEITILKDGDLIINNSMQEEIISIKNCTKGEVISLDGRNKIINSNMRSPIGNDFNYKFPMICNEVDDGFVVKKDNIFTSSLPCIITMSYSPICKMGVI